MLWSSHSEAEEATTDFLELSIRCIDHGLEAAELSDVLLRLVG